MGIEDRLRRLEREANSVPDSCPRCGGKIIFEEEMPDGSVRYPHGEPCPECGSSGSGGQVGTITIGMHRPGDEPSREMYSLE